MIRFKTTKDVSKTSKRFWTSRSLLAGHRSRVIGLHPYIWEMVGWGPCYPRRPVDGGCSHGSHLARQTAGSLSLATAARDPCWVSWPLLSPKMG